MRALLPPRSSPARDAALERLRRESWDILVVGGGITGVAVARDAALRGLKTALVEREDLAFGTSSRSSRLIHGGLRYLASFDLALVREGLVERQRLLRAAPGLVRAVRFVYPVYAGDPDPVWKVHLGVTLYEALAFGYGLGGRQRLTAAELQHQVPGLRGDGLAGGVSYLDAATHDARLTLAVARSAADAGALIVSRCGARELLSGGRLVAGVVAEDRIAESDFPLRARATILCCGPWQKLYAAATVAVRTARGTHLSLPSRRLPLSSFIALRSPRDGRLAFAMPIGRYAVLGTTDVDDPRRPGEIRATPADVDYLLELANHAFPAVDVSTADIRGVWAGVRPLVADGRGGAADEMSRRHHLVAGPPGLWVLTGGKLTTHRAMAEDCVDHLAAALERAGVEVGPCLTAKRALAAGDPERGVEELVRLGLATPTARSLALLHGARTRELAARLAVAEGASLEERLLAAEVDLAVDEEWALALDDVLLRRVSPGALDLVETLGRAGAAARRLALRLGWSEAEERQELAGFRRGIERDLEAAGVVPPGA